MKVYPTSQIRNISILGSSGSGKTTLTEAMLYKCGVISRKGGISTQNTVSDFSTIEKEYGYSVSSSIISLEWKERKLNFIDCPDPSDFIGEVITALNVTDTALMLLNAQYGLEVATINQLRYVKDLKKPVIFLVNHLDAEKADFDDVVNQLKGEFGNKAVVVQYPYNTGPDFDAVIDVMRLKMYKWKPNSEDPEELEIPENEKEKALDLHQKLVEAAAENEESLMDKFFDKGSLSVEDMRMGIRWGLVNRDLFPIFCVCAKKDLGVKLTLDFVSNVAPYVSDQEPPKTTDGVEVKPDPKGPTSLFFFKTTFEPHVGEVCCFKVMSGTVHEGDDLTNENRGSKERIGQLFVATGQQRTKISELEAGDIGVTVKLKDVRTGNTLNDKVVDYKFSFIKFPDSKYKRAIKPKNEKELEKLNEILIKLREEDPTWVIENSKELRQLIVGGQGEFHLKSLKWRLENIYKIPVEYSEPRVSYRETIVKPARAEYKHKKQSGGAGQFAEVQLIIEPYEEGKPIKDVYNVEGKEIKVQVRNTETFDLDWGGKLEFVNSIVGGAIDARFLPAIRKGITQRLEQGPLTGSYAQDVRVIVYDGKMHPVDSNEISFMLAGRNAFSDAFKKAAPRILEPICDLVVSTPSEKLGDVMSDLQTRRALILGMESDGRFEILKARVPLKEIQNYSVVLNSITGGRSTFELSFSGFELMPNDVQEKLLVEYENSTDED